MDYIEKIYAGWLAKVIGVRLGAPTEGWSYQYLKDKYGEITGYVQDFKQFATDDDTNGPLFFLRALEDKKGESLTAQDVAEALLNYACFERGFFWWGGYGISTEHTAYLNLRAGVKAPQSGSIALNGSTVAEQIGGQIFIDTWGLVAPGDPDRAAEYARKAASVTHDGNGVYGGIFIAVCISYAFVERDITAIIEKGLSYIPADCEYTRVVRAVMAFHKEHPENWRDCFDYIYRNFGYDKYPGNCHIIPNTAVMILSLLYGKGDFSDTLNICNMCGWDTDCNVGNVATIMGVRCGLDAIDFDKWRKPINDILICSGVLGSLNIMDIPYGAAYIASLAAKDRGEKLPEPWDKILEKRLDYAHFEFPGSTHGMRLRAESGSLVNTTEAAHTGERSLKVTAAGKAYLYQKTYYQPDDFDDSRYDPSFSPTLYPGQSIHGSLRLAGGTPCKAYPYVHDLTSGEIILAEQGTQLSGADWAELSFHIPAMENGVLDEAGFLLVPESGEETCVYLDDFYQDGSPEYTQDCGKLWQEKWMNGRSEVCQFTKMKGLTYLQDGKLHLSCADFGETYTGGQDWEDYRAAFTVTSVFGDCHMVNVRVQGAIRSYGVGFGKAGTFGIYKNDNGYRPLAETTIPWEVGKTYEIAVEAKGSTITAFIDGEKLLEVTDQEHPYLHGSIGLAVQNCSHISCGRITVQPVK